MYPRQAREDACEQVVTGLSFTSYWSRKRCEIFQPIITLDIQLKTALTDANNPMNQSELEASTGNRRQARENNWVGFASHWLRRINRRVK